ncbi:MAG: mechanosensitive ion channel family protein [Clostridia bacterium]|nr:mechanosensitive ion channel family protein [Clostridia bacterium]MBQ4248510.1 mechanosensitive ion channel family protein [Clostridia bacterium]
MDIFSRFSEFLDKNPMISTVLGIIVVALVTVIIYRVVRHIFNRINIKNKHTQTHLVFLEKIIRAAVIILGIFGIIMQIKPLQQFAISALASSGIVVLVLGFAAKEAMGNIVNGLFISVFKPFAVGDRVRIEAQNLAGIVEDITLRHTVIRTIENNRLIIPNTTMSNSIIENFNYSDDNTCTYLDVGIGYDADIDKAIRIISEVVGSHPDYRDIRKAEQMAKGEPKVKVRVTGFGESSVELRAYIWTKTYGEGYNAACDMRYEIKKRFDEEGVEIPYSYQNIIIKKADEVKSEQ